MSEDFDSEQLTTQLSAIELELENIGTQLENVCERLDSHHKTVLTGLLGVLRKTGAMLPPELVEAHHPDSDILYDKAREAVIKARKASTSFLQRRLGVGYSRSAALIDLLEARGVIGPDRGAKPRAVLHPPPRKRS